MKSTVFTALLLVASAVTAAASIRSVLEDLQTEHEARLIEKRAYYLDGFKIFMRKRNAHACMMSIVFIVLFPLGAISMHLPLRGVRVTTRIHLPIQILGLAMMIGAMGLGIDIARNDLNYFSSSVSVKAHVVIGLLTTSTLILFQPAMGIAQHMYFKKHGKKSLFAYAHRWLGRVAIFLGWINTGLGFQLVPLSLVSNSSLAREYSLMGILGLAWFGLLAWDAYRHHLVKKDKLGAYRLVWNKGLMLRGPPPKMGADEENKDDIKLAPSNPNPLGDEGWNNSTQRVGERTTVAHE